MFEQLPLKDIHMPDPVSWWPPAPGWWLLPVVLALLVVLARILRRSLRRMRDRRRLRRQALAELSRIEKDLDESGDLSGALERTSVLLRRVAVSVFPGRRVAGRAGPEWSEWLQRTGPASLDAAIIEAMTRAPYRRVPEVRVDSALTAARQWIEHVTRRTGRRADHEGAS